MQSMTPSPLRHWLLSPAERLIEEYRSKAPMLPSGIDIDHHSIELKMAVRILMLQKKLKAAEASLREAESCAENFVGSNWLKTSMLRRAKEGDLRKKLQPNRRQK